MSIDQRTWKAFGKGEIMKNKDRIFIGACCGLPLGIVDMAIGSIFALIFNKIMKSRWSNVA